VAGSSKSKMPTSIPSTALPDWTPCAAPARGESRKVPYYTASHTNPHTTLHSNKNREDLRQRKEARARGSGLPTASVGHQCSNLLYKIHRSHRCKVHRNHRNGVPWHPLHRGQRGIPMHSYENRSQLRAVSATQALNCKLVNCARPLPPRRRPGQLYVRSTIRAGIDQSTTRWLYICCLNTTTFHCGSWNFLYLRSSLF
jgi:hypothetical protein